MSIPNQRRSSRIQRIAEDNRQDALSSAISADADSSQNHDYAASLASVQSSHESHNPSEESYHLAETLRESTISEEVDGAEGGVREERDTSLDCAICLQPCVHPAKLPCSHIFCFLCLKGFAQQSRRCAMCRTPFPHDYLERPELVEVPEPSSLENGYQWFYEGRNGWWQYDDRTSQELELNYQAGERLFELLIAGNIYVIDFHDMVQYRKVDTIRKRRIKRDILQNASRIKGIAGLRLGNEVDRPAVPSPPVDQWLLTDHNYSIAPPLRRVRVEATSLGDPRGWVGDSSGSDIDDSSRHDHLYTRREMDQISQSVRSEAYPQYPSAPSVYSTENPWRGRGDLTSSQPFTQPMPGDAPRYSPTRRDMSGDSFSNLPYHRQLTELLHISTVVRTQLRYVRRYNLYYLRHQQSQIEVSRYLENLLIYVDQVLLYPCLLQLSQLLLRTSPRQYEMSNAAMRVAFDCRRHTDDVTEVTRRLSQHPRYDARSQGHPSDVTHEDSGNTRFLSRFEQVAVILLGESESVRAATGLLRRRLLTTLGWIRAEEDVERSRSNCYVHIMVWRDLATIVNELRAFFQPNYDETDSEDSLTPDSEGLRRRYLTGDVEDTTTMDPNNCRCRTCARSEQNWDSSQQYSEAEQDRSSSEYSSNEANPGTTSRPYVPYNRFVSDGSGLLDAPRTHALPQMVEPRLMEAIAGRFAESRNVEIMEDYMSAMRSLLQCEHPEHPIRSSEDDVPPQVTGQPSLQANRITRDQENERPGYRQMACSVGRTVSTPNHISSGVTPLEFSQQRRASTNMDPDARVTLRNVNSNRHLNTSDANPCSCPVRNAAENLTNHCRLAHTRRSHSTFETDSIERTSMRNYFDDESPRNYLNDPDDIRSSSNEEFSVNTRSTGVSQRNMSERPANRWWGENEGSGRIAFTAVENGDYRFARGLYYLDEDGHSGNSTLNPTSVNSNSSSRRLASRVPLCIVADVHSYQVATANHPSFVTDTNSHSDSDENRQNLFINDTRPSLTDENLPSRMMNDSRQSGVTEVNPSFSDVTENVRRHSCNTVTDTINNSDSGCVRNEISSNEIPFDHQYSSVPRQVDRDLSETVRSYSRELERSVTLLRDSLNARVAVQQDIVDRLRSQSSTCCSPANTPPPVNVTSHSSHCGNHARFPSEDDRDSLQTAESHTASQADYASERDRRETGRLFRNSVRSARLEDTDEQSGVRHSHDSQNGEQQSRLRMNKSSKASQNTSSTVYSVPNAQSEFYFGNAVFNQNTGPNPNGNRAFNQSNNSVFNRDRNTGVAFSYGNQVSRDHIAPGIRTFQVPPTSLPYFFPVPDHNQDGSSSMPCYVHEPPRSQESAMSMPHFAQEPHASYAHACPMSDVSSWYGDLATYPRPGITVANATSRETERELSPRRESMHPSGSSSNRNSSNGNSSSDNSSHNTVSSQPSSSDREHEDCLGSSQLNDSEHSRSGQDLNRSSSETDARRPRNYESYDNFGFEDILSQTNLSFNAKVFVPKGTTPAGQASNETASHPQHSVGNERSESTDTPSENGSTITYFGSGTQSENGSTNTYSRPDNQSEMGSTNTYIFGADTQSEHSSTSNCLLNRPSQGSTNVDDTRHNSETESTNSYVPASESGSTNTYYFGCDSHGNQPLAEPDDVKTDAQPQQETQERSIDERTIKHSYGGERTETNDAETAKQNGEKEEEGAKGYAETIVKHFVKKSGKSSRGRRLTVIDHNYASKEKLSRQDSEHSYACKKLKSSRSDRKSGGNLSKNCAVDTEHAYSRNSKAGALMDHEYAKISHESSLIDQMNYLTLRESTTDEEDEDM